MEYYDYRQIFIISLSSYWMQSSVFLIILIILIIMLASLTFFIDLITFRYWCLIGFNLNCCFTSWIRWKFFSFAFYQLQ